MNVRTLASQAAAGLAAGMLSLLAHAGFVWNLDGQAPLRIDVDAAATRTASVTGPVDAFIPLPDGSAWLRRGAELVSTILWHRVQARCLLSEQSGFPWGNLP